MAKVIQQIADLVPKVAYHQEMSARRVTILNSSSQVQTCALARAGIDWLRQEHLCSAFVQFLKNTTKLGLPV